MCGGLRREREPEKSRCPRIFGLYHQLCVFAADALTSLPPFAHRIAKLSLALSGGSFSDVCDSCVHVGFRIRSEVNDGPRKF